MSCDPAIELYPGQWLDQPFNVTQGGAPYDLGTLLTAGARLQLTAWAREDPDTIIFVKLCPGPSGDTSWEVTDAVNGETVIRFRLSDTDTVEPGDYRFDVFLVDASGERYALTEELLLRISRRPPWSP